MLGMNKLNSILLLPLFLLPALFSLFASLSAYSLWDDETMVGLVAQGVIKTGDTTAVIDHNVVAYREGIALVGLKDRFSPPLATYLVALAFWMFGPSSWAARVPFAILGLLTFLLVWFWLNKEKVSLLFRSILSIGILGNVSLILYYRQARYYALILFFTILIGYLYCRPKKTKIWAATLGLSIVALFLSHPLACAALGIALLFDVLLYQRKWLQNVAAHWFWLFIAPFFVIGLSLLIWNPYMTKTAEYQTHISLGDRLTLFLWTWRDILSAEFIAPLPAVFALITGSLKKEVLPFRCLQAVLLIIAVVCAATHQMVSVTSVSDIRYVISVIPIGIFLGSWGICSVFGKYPRFGLVFAVLVFWTNLFNGNLFRGQGLQSTPLLFWHELFYPNPEPYAPTSDWIRKHVPPRSSIWVLPDYMTYPLMFHAPEATYAWQLNSVQRTDPQYISLPDIHFKGNEMPDYVIAFGPVVDQVRGLLGQWAMQGFRYNEETRLMTFWKDLYRPELFWRTFKPVENYDPNTEAIYIFKKQP
jgi:4-amino-4-deoxy-L-arabinose transferase-like glycosyltransferase